MSALQSLRTAVAVLRKYGSCDAADALSRLGVVGGGFLPGLVLHSPCFQYGDTKIVGPVQTVNFRPNAEKGKYNAVQGHYIDHVKAEHILFLNGPRGISNAIYGGIMSARAKHLGAIGTVISGRLRDINEQRDAAWPVWARGVGTMAGGEVCFPAEIDAPSTVETTIDGVQHRLTVRPGDVLVADADGVVCIPRDLVERVAGIIPQLAEADKLSLADVKTGRSVTAAFTEHRGRLQC